MLKQIMEPEDQKKRDIAVISQKQTEGSYIPNRIRDYRRRWAVVVGVRDYPFASGLPMLKNAVNDATLVYRLLIREYGFTGTLLCRPEDVGAARFDSEFSSYEVRGGELEASGNGSRAEIINAVDRVSKIARPDDLFVFFYSGHGTEEGGGFMVPYGAIKDEHSTYLMYEEFFGSLAALPCKHRILLFDCCYAGIATRAVKDIEVKKKASFPAPRNPMILLRHAV